MGQGARTVFAQIAAEELGAPLDWVTVVMGDTAIVPYDQQTSASRSTVLMGNAVLAACRDIQAQLRAMAARAPRASTRRAIVVERGVVRLPDRRAPDPSRSLKAGLGRLGGELTGIGEVRKDADPGHPLAGAPAFFEFNCTAIEVEVDRGDRRRHDRPPRHRVATSARPSTRSRSGCRTRARRSMGLGHTLMEHYIFDERRPDPEPGRHRLPDPDQHGPAARAASARRSRTATARARTAPRA